MAKVIRRKSDRADLELTLDEAGRDEGQGRRADVYRVKGTLGKTPIEGALAVYWDGEVFAGWDLPSGLTVTPPDLFKERSDETNKAQDLLDLIEPHGPQH